MKLRALPRRRPVDLLFGEDVELKPKLNPVENNPRAPQTSGYMVEPPRPVTSLRPPPPEFPNDWRVNEPPEQAMVMDAPVEVIAPLDPIAPPPKPLMAEVPAACRRADCRSRHVHDTREPPGARRELASPRI